MTVRRSKLTSRFRRDTKRCIKRGLDMKRFRVFLQLLENDTPLPPAARPHLLKGQYSGYWECHIAPDWLLIYSYLDEDTLLLYRTGTHADLFD
ncbi:MAG: type II toxin-antitoxin system YafQ family toxin [Ahrensia sp.]|nr:type II toxin-antitoxin system YafQ family toxin [Ahrensia sp.]